MARDFPDRIEIVPFRGNIDAVVRPPGSKSITNRALLISALATGRSILRGALLAEDTEAMIQCVTALGATVDIDGATITIGGTGGTIAARAVLDANQSGTTARFVAAVLLLGGAPITLDADEAMRRRPMGPTIASLRALGAEVRELGAVDHLPIEVDGARVRHDAMPVARLDGSGSSQFASGLLLAGACMTHGLRVEIEGTLVSRPYLALTVSVMRAFGATVDEPDERTFVVHPGGYRAREYEVEPDASGASYFAAAAAIVGGRVTIEGLGSRSMQGDVAFLDVLSSMGAIVECSDSSATIASGSLGGVDVDMADISDTAQTFAAVAAFASGPSRARGIGFIRAKETDRLAAVVSELQRLGCGAVEEPDGFRVEPRPMRGATVATYDDHRMAMSMALIGLRVPGVVIDDPGCVAKTFPTYFELLETLRPGDSQ